MDDEGCESEDVGGSERSSSEVSVPPVFTHLIDSPRVSGYLYVSQSIARFEDS